MLLDLVLPDAAGLDVLREIRSADGATSRYDPRAAGDRAQRPRQRGRPGPRLREGADDYVVKPFHYPELVARVAAVLRRRRGGREGPLRIGELVIDPATRSVRVGERDGRAGEQGVRAAADAGRRAAPGLQQGGAAARRLGLPLAGPHPDPRLARQPPAAKARSRATAASCSIAGASATG